MDLKAFLWNPQPQIAVNCGAVSSPFFGPNCYNTRAICINLRRQLFEPFCRAFSIFMAKAIGIMKILMAFVLVLLTHIGLAQFPVAKIDKNSIPKTIKYVGHIINAVRWTDSLGDNIVITTETGETQSKSTSENDYRDAALYAYHYLVQADSCNLTWKIYDFTKDCPVEIKANFVKNTFAITDLNRDGKAEVWVMYKTVCHGDVSPCSMKIIMYENNKKFAVRGTTKVKPSDKYEGGEYNFDEAFKNGPEVFRQYAMQLWNKNVTETWE